MAAGFTVTAGGLLLLSGVDAGGRYVTDVLPGMLVAGLGLGVVLVSVAVAVLSGARDEESGMLSGLNTTGHEIGGSLGIAVLLTVATGATGADGVPTANGLADAFLVAAGVAAGRASWRSCSSRPPGPSCPGCGSPRGSPSTSGCRIPPTPLRPAAARTRSATSGASSRPRSTRWATTPR